LSQQVHSKYALGDRQLQSPALPRHGLEALREQNTGLTPLLPAYTELTSSLSVDLSRDQNEITKVIGLTDSAFSNLFGVVKHKLCEKKFELKVDNVRFVGHPTLFDTHCFH